AGSQAILSQSVNGGGGNVETFLDFAAVEDGPPATEGNPGLILTSIMSLGGNAVDGMMGSDIIQRHTGGILTTSDRSSGMVLQSIGGGGGTATTILAGDGGTMTMTALLGAINTDGASGGNVSATRDGEVITFGDLSSGG